MESKYKFKKSESFYIREGWFEKALNAIKERSDLFSKNNGVHQLGIGSNMVKGLKYWLTASGLIEAKTNKVNLTEFGKLVLEYDQYCESNFVWLLIHYHLATNEILCPLFYFFFNSDLKTFTKESLTAYYNQVFNEKLEKNVLKSYIEDDTTTFLKTYVEDEAIINPEDNNHCPLSDFKLIKKDGKILKRCKIRTSVMSPYIAYYALLKSIDSESINIDDISSFRNSPLSLFNIDKNLFMQYMSECGERGLISINRTANINTIYFEKKLDLPELFKMYFEGGN